MIFDSFVIIILTIICFLFVLMGLVPTGFIPDDVIKSQLISEKYFNSIKTREQKEANPSIDNKVEDSNEFGKEKSI